MEMQKYIVTLHNNCTDETEQMLNSKGYKVIYRSKVIPTLLGIETDKSIADLVRLDEVVGVRLEEVGKLYDEPISEPIVTGRITVDKATLSSAGNGDYRISSGVISAKTLNGEVENNG
jgi:hypothetical protein